MKNNDKKKSNIIYTFNNFSKKIKADECFSYTASDYILRWVLNEKKNQIDFIIKYDQMKEFFKNSLNKIFRFFPICMDSSFRIICINLEEAAKTKTNDGLLSVKISDSETAEALAENKQLSREKLNTLLLCIMEFCGFVDEDFYSLYESVSESDSEEKLNSILYNILVNRYDCTEELKEKMSSAFGDVRKKNLYLIEVTELMLMYEYRLIGKIKPDSSAISKKEEKLLGYLIASESDTNSDDKTETVSQSANMYYPVLETQLSSYEHLNANEDFKNVLKNDTAFCEIIIKDINSWFTVLDKVASESASDSIYSVDFGTLAEKVKKDSQKMLETLQGSAQKNPAPHSSAERISSGSASSNTSTSEEKEPQKTERVPGSFYDSSADNNYRYYEVAFESLYSNSGDLKLNLNEKPILVKRKSIPFILHEGRIILNPCMYINGELTMDQLTNGTIDRVFEHVGFFGESCKIKSIEGAELSSDNIVVKKGTIYFR